MPRRLSLTILSTALLLACACGSALAAGWVSQAGAVNGTGAAISESHVAVDDAGNVYAAWLEGPVLKAAERPVGGDFEQPQTVASDVTDLAIGVDGAGNALIVWRTGTVISQARRTAGAGSFVSDGALSDPAASVAGPPRLAVSRGGNAVIAFKDTTNGGSTQRISVGLGSASTALPTDPGSGFTHYSESTVDDHPAVAINDAGDAVVAFTGVFAGSTAVPVVNATYRVRGQGFDSGRKVSDGSATVTDPAVDVDSSGRALAMWVDGSTVRASTRPAGAGQAWGPPQDVEKAGAAAEPRVAFDAADGAAAIWNGNRELHGATMAPGAAFGSVQTLAPNEAPAEIQLDSSLPTGTAAGVWSSGDPGPVRAIIRPTGGAFGSISPLTSSGHTGGFPDVAVDPLGNAAAVWADSSPAGSQLLAAEYDATAPTLSNEHTPGALLVGENGSFSADAADDWTAPVITWDFGDGTTGTGPSVSHAYGQGGVYHASAIATDGAGNVSAAYTAPVIVFNPPQPPPPPPHPTLGVDFNASSVKGKVLVSVPLGKGGAGRVLARRPVARSAAAIKPPPGYSPFRLLGKDDNIPVGSILDATHGTSAITMATNKSGTATQTGQFSQGLYKTKQSKKSRLTTAVLMGGGNFKQGCRAPKARGAVAAATRRPKRRLFASVHGRFRTRGRHSTATVRGTKFLTKDTCNGTTTIVLRGVVVVRDLVKHKNHTLRAGHRFTARPRSLRRTR